MFTAVEKIMFIATFIVATITGLAVPQFQAVSIKEKYAEIFEKPTIVGFTMEGCPACRRQKPEWNALRARGYRIVIYDQAQCRDLVKHFGLYGYPTTLVVVDGTAKPRQFVGWTPANTIAGYAEECKEGKNVDIDIGPIHIEVSNAH